MRDVEYVVGSAGLTKKGLRPYSEEALAFCQELSQALRKEAGAKAYPDLAALAFWCRRGNLQKLKEGCPEAGERLGRGLCFHIAPGNIPVNFAFSYLFGLLSGCSNLVRLPSKRYPQNEILCEIIAGLLPRHPEVEARTAFVRYPADQEVTAEFSKEADARVIWGGDATIAGIRGMATKARCVDVCFADRYSLCLLDGEAVLQAKERELARLAEDFYNDTYLMDQNACSSPQLVLWRRDSEGARQRFWEAVYGLAKEKYELQAALAVEKYARLCRDALEEEKLAHAQRWGNLLYRVELESLTGDVSRLRGKGGYFYEWPLESLEELAEVVTEKYQTVTCFGVAPEEVREMVCGKGLRGIDRIVAVGKAMDIGILWDGYDIVRMLSRYVALV